MNMKQVNSLFHVEMSVVYKERTAVIDKLVFDTGAAHSLFSSDAVSELGIFFENGDQLVSAYGIGGEEYSFRKQVDGITLGSYQVDNFKLDFGDLHGWGINGLIGLDILATGRFVIDFEKCILHHSM